MSRIEHNGPGAVQIISDELRGFAATAVRSSAAPFQLRQILRFIGQVVQVVDQTFETAYALLIELRYMSEDDVELRRHVHLQKELDLLLAKSHFRESLEICSRLRYLEEQYETEVRPIVESQGLDSAAWSSVLELINEYEGSLIELIRGTVADIRLRLSVLSPQSLPGLREEAGHWADVLRRGLDSLRELNARILGLSGQIGLLELTAISGGNLSQISVTQFLDQRYSVLQEGTFMGDTYSNISNSTINSRSLFNNAFNKVKLDAGEDAAEALRKVAEFVALSGNKEAGEILDQFNEELAKPEPRKSLLKRSWDNLVQVLPAVTAIAGAAGAIAKLFT